MRAAASFPSQVLDWLPSLATTVQRGANGAKIMRKSCENAAKMLCANSLRCDFARFARFLTRFLTKNSIPTTLFPKFELLRSLLTTPPGYPHIRENLPYRVLDFVWSPQHILALRTPRARTLPGLPKGLILDPRFGTQFRPHR